MKKITKILLIAVLSSAVVTPEAKPMEGAKRVFASLLSLGGKGIRFIKSFFNTRQTQEVREHDVVYQYTFVPGEGLTREVVDPIDPEDVAEPVECPIVICPEAQPHETENDLLIAQFIDEDERARDILKQIEEDRKLAESLQD